jgi:inner membrane protein
VTTLVTHAALPWLARRLVEVPTADRRRLLLASMICACVPDLDVIGYAFAVPSTSPWSHRGLTHSLAFAALLAFAVTQVFFRASRVQRLIFGCLFAATAAHGVLDAFTHGEVGVALFAPFDDRRWLLPWNPVPAMPLGVDELFGRWGALVLFDEALLVLVPWALLVALARRRRGSDPSWGQLAVASLAWLTITGAYALELPELAGRRLPRVATHVRSDPDDDLREIPLDGLSDGLVTRFDDWKARGLLDRELEPRQRLWSAGFFPYWFGGEAGRWHDSTLQLAWRTLARVEVPRRDDPTPIERRSPTEKYDLMVGDDGFGATRASLEHSHNASPRPRFWYGLCNGVAAAAMAWPEPHLAVDVTSPTG